MATRRKPAPKTPAEPTNAWVGKECLVYQRMAKLWDLPDTLMGGTPAMVKAGKKFLPQEDGEQDKAYKVRLDRSVLHGYFRGAVRQLSARPFAEDVTIRVGQEKAELPELLAPIETDADYSGSSLTQFGRRLFSDALQRGLVHFLVEMPGDVRELSVLEERKRGVHPYFCHVSAKDLIGWESKKGKGNREELTQIRIRECHVVKVDGEEREVEHVRVWNAPVEGKEAAEGQPAVEGVPGTWALYKRVNETDSYEFVEGGPHTFPGIPLVTVYFNRTGFMEAEPPLADLAELEKAHWASNSDQTNILRYARVPKLAIEGLSPDQQGQPTTMGVQSVLKLPPGSKAYWVEPEGHAIGAGRQHILDLQAEMNARSVQPLMERTGDETATGQELADKKSTSDMKAYVRALEGGFDLGFAWAALFVNKKLAKDTHVDIFSDWAPPSLAFEEVRLLKEIRANGDLSRKAFLSQLKGRLLPEDFDVQEELDAIEDEGPDLASFGLPPGGEGEGEPPPGAEQDDEEKPPKKAA